MARGHTAWCHFTEFSTPVEGLSHGEPVTILEAQGVDFQVRSADGREHTVFVASLTPSYEVLTVHGWINEAHPAALSELLHQLRPIPNPGSKEVADLVATHRWRLKVLILRRHGREVPDDILADATVVGLLPLHPSFM